MGDISPTRVVAGHHLSGDFVAFELGDEFLEALNLKLGTHQPLTGLKVRPPSEASIPPCWPFVEP